MPAWARDRAFISRYIACMERQKALIEFGEFDPDDRSHWSIEAPAVQRCCGGMVDLRTGEFVPTPWRVSFEHGSLIITKKTGAHA